MDSEESEASSCSLRMVCFITWFAHIACVFSSHSALDQHLPQLYTLDIRWIHIWMAICIYSHIYGYHRMRASIYLVVSLFALSNLTVTPREDYFSWMGNRTRNPRLLRRWFARWVLVLMSLVATHVGLQTPTHELWCYDFFPTFDARISRGAVSASVIKSSQEYSTQSSYRKATCECKHEDTPPFTGGSEYYASKVL